MISLRRSNRFSLHLFPSFSLCLCLYQSESWEWRWFGGYHPRDLLPTVGISRRNRRVDRLHHGGNRCRLPTSFVSRGVDRRRRFHFRSVWSEGGEHEVWTGGELGSGLRRRIDQFERVERVERVEWERESEWSAWLMLSHGTVAI